MKPGLIFKLALSFESVGLKLSEKAERFIELGRKISNELLFETMANQKHRTKCAKLARAMSFQNNEATKMKLWNLFMNA